MKPTIKVSIGGYAFNLEENAYQIIDDYLKTLTRYFANKHEGEEIISDVESRMAELLLMRNQAGVISEDDAKAVISIMGSPNDFADDGFDASSGSTQEEKTRKKKLYRDADDNIIGGVCSGLGYYLGIDPVLIRILFVALIFLFNFLPWNNTGIYVVFGYIILWIVMPKATTFTQKLEMRGAEVSIEEIEKRSQTGTSKPKSSSVVNVIKIICGIFLGIVFISSASMLIAIVAAFFGLYISSGIPEINICLEAFNIYTLDQKVAMIMAICLPLIGLCYLCVKLLFQKRFTVTDLVISIVAFLLWIGAGFYVGGVILNLVKKHRNEFTSTQTIPVSTQSETLYIRLDESLVDAEPMFGSEDLAYIVDDKGNSSIFFFPEVEVRKDTSLSDFKIELQKRAFDETKGKARRRAKDVTLTYSVTDSLIVIKPQLYSKQHLWDRKLFRLIITTPADRKVVVEEPLENNKLRYYDF